MAPTTILNGVDRLLTIEQAADILAVNPRMVRRLVETRRIAFVKVGRHVRFRECDLVTVMQYNPPPSVVAPHVVRCRI